MFKRGIGHVEAILSFLLFIGFISAALFFFIPSGGEQVIDSTLLYAINGVMKNTTVDFESYSVKIERDSIPKDQKTIAIDFPTEIATLNQEYKVRAESYEGKSLPATREGNIVYVDFGEEDFVILKFSAGLTSGQSATSKPAENSAYYKISSSNKRKVISEQKIFELNQSYYQKYDSLKYNLGIPSQVDFGFSFSLPAFDIVGEKEVPIGIEVFSSLSRRELLLQDDGALIFGEVSVKVW